MTTRLGLLLVCSLSALAAFASEAAPRAGAQAKATSSAAKLQPPPPTAPPQRLPSTVQPKQPVAQHPLPTGESGRLKNTAFPRAGVYRYHIAMMSPAGRIAALHLSRADGAMLMPDIGKQRLVQLSWRDAPMGIAYASGNGYTIVLRGGRGRAIGTMTLALNDTLTIALDPDRDGVADLVEIWNHTVRQSVFVRTGLGENLLQAMMAGRDVYCLPMAGAGDGGWMGSFDDRAGLDMCAGPSSRSSSASGFGTGMGGGKGPMDPMALACSAFGESLSRPARFSGVDRAGDGDGDIDAGPISDSVDFLASLIPDVGTAAVLGGIMKALVDAYGGEAVVSAISNISGLPTAAELAATGASTTGAVTADTVAVAACVIRPMSVRDSGACRYVIPVDVGTGFRRMSVHDSGPCRYL